TALRAPHRRHRPHPGWTDRTVPLRHRVRTARPAARTRRCLRGSGRQRRRHAAPLLLPLRPDDRAVRPRHHAGPAHRRRLHGARARRVRSRPAAAREADQVAMWSRTPLFPESASTMASRVDALYFFLLAVTAVFSLLIAVLIVYYAVLYRR